jgi:hypothetical protein
VAFEHVEGHQDIKYPGLPLSWPATLNQRCDEIASLHLDSATTSIPTVTFLPASQVSISVGSATITHHIPTQLRTFAGTPGMRAHYCKHHEWEDPATFDLVDWPRFHGATLSNTFLKRLFVTTWINSLLPLQRRQHRFKQSPSAHCPSACGCVDEDGRHFLRCAHPQRLQAWDSFLPTLGTVME